MIHIKITLPEEVAPPTVIVFGISLGAIPSPGGEFGFDLDSSSDSSSDDDKNDDSPKKDKKGKSPKVFFYELQMNEKKFLNLYN